MAKKTRATRDERIRNDLFGGDTDIVFDTKSGGFVPLPFEFRLLLRFLTLAELRVLVYLHLRSGREGISFPTPEEIGHDIGVRNAKHVRPLLGQLERKGFIRTGQKGGRMYYLVLDPAVPIRRLLELKAMSTEQLRDVNDIRESVGRDPVEYGDADDQD